MLSFGVVLTLKAMSVTAYKQPLIAVHSVKCLPAVGDKHGTILCGDVLVSLTVNTDGRQAAWAAQDGIGTTSLSLLANPCLVLFICSTVVELCMLICIRQRCGVACAFQVLFECGKLVCLTGAGKNGVCLTVCLSFTLGRNARHGTAVAGHALLRPLEFVAQWKLSRARGFIC